MRPEINKSWTANGGPYPALMLLVTILLANLKTRNFLIVLSWLITVINNDKTVVILLLGFHPDASERTIVPLTSIGSDKKVFNIYFLQCFN